MSEEDVIESIRQSVSSLKYKLERQDAISRLAEVDMTIDRLIETRAGIKITDVFRSSRFEEMARNLHGKWIAQADKELQERWDEHKHKFLTKEQLASLDKAQAKWKKKHGIMDRAASVKKPPPARAVNPYERVYRKHVPIIDSPSPPPAEQRSHYGAASTDVDPDNNFVAYNYSTASIKRPRGRPRTNFSIKGENRRRGRPPTKRY